MRRLNSVAAQYIEFGSTKLRIFKIAFFTESTRRREIWKKLLKMEKIVGLGLTRNGAPKTVNRIWYVISDSVHVYVDNAFVGPQINIALSLYPR